LIQLLKAPDSIISPISAHCASLNPSPEIRKRLVGESVNLLLDVHIAMQRSNVTIAPLKQLNATMIVITLHLVRSDFRIRSKIFIEISSDPTNIAVAARIAVH
jgi:hypothetical protein